MKDFLNSYATLMENNHEVIGQVHTYTIYLQKFMKILP